MLIKKLQETAKIIVLFAVWLIALLLLPIMAVLNGLCDWLIDEEENVDH